MTYEEAFRAASEAAQEWEASQWVEDVDLPLGARISPLAYMEAQWREQDERIVAAWRHAVNHSPGVRELLTTLAIATGHKREQVLALVENEPTGKFQGLSLKEALENPPLPDPPK